MTPLEVIRLYPPHDRTLHAMLRSRAAVAPNRTFLVFEAREWTYAECLAEVDRIASLLAVHGVRSGDRMGVMAHNHPTTVFTFFALARMGAVMVPINPEFGVEEAHYVLAHAQVSGVLCAPDVLPVVRDVVARMESRPWIMLNAAAPAIADIPALPDALRAIDTNHELPAGIAEDLCVFIYTSGTTGFPKGVMHAQRTIAMAGEAFVARVRLQPTDRALVVMPMFHINALGYSLAGVLAAGATLILVAKFSASRFWQIALETGATQVNTLAAITSILMRRPRSEFAPGHRLHTMYGAPFDAEVFRVFQREFGIPKVIEGYGMSEIPGVLNNPFAGPQKIGSMGRIGVHPDPDVKLAEVMIVDEAGAALPDGAIGEIAVRTPLVMKGYFRDPEQTSAAFRDGWFMTGDLAWRDADGYFWFVSRRKDIIRKRGENISGAELDRVIGLHPAVQEVAAIAVPSDLGEDEILVAIVTRAGISLSAEEVVAWCRERLAPIKVPRYVWFTDALPHTPTHRIAKFRLRQMQDLRTRAIDLGT
jgi:crotonobetaine/carnitine-CoA ligase